MNILIVCNWGKNRSSYLASYLKNKEYIVKFGGVFSESKNPITQEMIDWSNVIIFVQSETKKMFAKKFKVDKQKTITLNVEDRIEVLRLGKKITEEMDWTEIQKEFVYPELERQIERYLPFEG